jgi:hypothetical protein
MTTEFRVVHGLGCWIFGGERHEVQFGLGKNPHI